jgi:hypothetical protein
MIHNIYPTKYTLTRSLAGIQEREMRKRTGTRRLVTMGVGSTAKRRKMARKRRMSQRVVALKITLSRHRVS